MGRSSLLQKSDYNHRMSLWRTGVFLLRDLQGYEKWYPNPTRKNLNPPDPTREDFQPARPDPRQFSTRPTLPEFLKTCSILPFSALEV
ncbi:hypothetical protein I4U23_017053 [Adineta vaga]|nr:hypothetical protein I4U23_017053 [Adineta vaga]